MKMDEFIDLITGVVLLLEGTTKELQNEQIGRFEANYFILKGECNGCCLNCPNSLCRSWGTSAFCSNCMNINCSENRRFENLDSVCSQECLSCKNVACVNHPNFKIKNLTKYI